MDNVLAIITARGGSKRIPKKNIKSFFGKPILSYSIEASINAGIFQEVMVSTDDHEIAEVAKQYGASVPFMRSGKTSDDFATTAEVIREVLESYKNLGKNFDYACCIYPTAPFVTSEKLSSAWKLLSGSDVNTVMPVTKFSFPIWRSLKMDTSGQVMFNWPEYANSRSQDLPASFHDCGQFYFFRTEPFLETGKLIGEQTLGLEVPESEVQDIDNEEDWKIAEIKYSFLIKKPAL
jgi:pseudaminic acid cytidylyltransferase